MDTFEDLYRRHVQAVFRFARSLVGSRETAEDLTSEAFLALHRNLASIDQSQLPGWLITVVRNRARDHWRRSTVEQRYVQQASETPAVEPPQLERWLLECRDLKPVHRTCLMTNGTPLRRIASSMYHLTRKTSTGESCVSPLDER